MDNQKRHILTVDPHPLLDLRAFVTVFPAVLGNLASSTELLALLSLGVQTPLQSSDAIRSAVRDLLRYGGFKPTGRSKPASEYLIKVTEQRGLSSINVAVDACNVVSLHSGLPISVVDLDLVHEPFRVGIAPPESSYLFNPSGQTMDVGRLLCLFDIEGPCANAVKDSQRTKTNPETRRTLTLIWGTKTLLGRATAADVWYQELLKADNALVELVDIVE
ncbi:MAG TPA: phenylalanine--tRNA ligase beta subunit-related protein [Pirellulaceae bacterium]|nr:phenylalanine--tRNA ligase beta subunit-related protein [Pirellulaceae bacterium]